MRIAGVEKLGYYPTPSVVIRAIAQWLRADAEQPYRILDPCCGAGEALAELAAHLGGNPETWGVELSPIRAEKAREVGTVIQGDWFNVQVSGKSASVILLNPPYDYDVSGERRMEIAFLRSVLDIFVPGGILIYIIPQHVLGYEQAAKTLLGYFDHLAVLRFPDGEFERFRQVVVFGTRRSRYQKPDGESVDALRALADAELPILGENPQAPWPMPVPAAPSKARMFIAELSHYERICRAAGMGWPPEMMGRESRSSSICPAMPLKKGHLAMLMSSGLMGTIRVEKNGEAVLIKGRVVKHVEEKHEEDSKGDPVTIHRDRFVTTIGVIDRKGARVIDDVEGVAALMENYGEEIARAILNTTPTYNLDPTPQEWGLVSTLGKNRKPLPNQEEPGLLDTQKHIAIAAARCCRKYGNAIIQGQMGTGKTTISLAAIELLGAYPALVMCPPILVEKWQREAHEVVPGIVTRELRTVGDARRFIQDYRAGRLGKKAIAVVASTAAKLGSGWGAAAASRHCVPEDRASRALFREAVARYRRARERLKEAGPEEAEEIRREVALARAEALGLCARVPVCPVCGEPILDKNGNPADFEDLDLKPLTCHRCNSPLYDFGKGQYHRWPVAEYIALKAHGFFKMLVADEVHEYRSKDSDRGLAFHKLVNATRYQIAMTGTFFAGKSTSIFWLLQRLRIGGVHRDYGYHDEMLWVRRYGVLETRQYKKNGGSEEYGAFNATRRGRVTVTELPGVSPAVLERILPNTLFVTLADLGVTLPPYREDVSAVSLPDRAQKQYDDMVQALKAQALQDRRLLSTWIQWALSRPNSCFRDEKVVAHVNDKRGKQVGEVVLMNLPAVPGTLPKEEWLAGLVAAEVKSGRKVLVFCRQTATRDIQPRLKEVLEEKGLRVAILYSSSSDARKREGWIRARAPYLDVLITNPGVVATGLDLIEFSTVVYYEVEFDLTVMWQAMARTYRPTQTQPVRVIFASYKSTMEHLGWGKMGVKMKHAKLLYGETVEGALVPQDEGDFLLELARDVLEGREIPALEVLFALSKPMEDSPLGCPTAPSRYLVTPRYTEEELRAMWEQQMQAQQKRQRRKVKVPSGQLALPGFAF